MALLSDVIINQQFPSVTLRRLDFSVVLLMFGVFVWTEGFISTGIPSMIWDQVGLTESFYQGILPVCVLLIFILVGCNLIGGVLTTVIILSQFPPCPNQLHLTQYLAWGTSIAGNLNLYGSTSNLIVAQKALQSLDFRLGFFEYMMFGFPTTLIYLAFGTIMIYALSNLY